MRTRTTAMMLLLAAVALTALVGPAAAAPVPSTATDPSGRSGPTALQGVSDDRPLGTADRVLVFSVPTLAWKDLDRVDAPNLERLLADSAVGDLSVRSVSRRTSASDGYATLNAGTRAEGTQQASLAFVAGFSTRGTDGDPNGVPAGAFEPEPPDEDVDPGIVPAPAAGEPESTDPSVIAPEAGENYDGSPAAEEFARRTGVPPRPGQVFNFGVVSMRELNAKLLFDAEVGAVGEALSAHGVDRAVIANGDHGEGNDDVNYRREASVGLMDRNGLVAHGRVGRTLLTADSSAPFGTRFDNEEVASAFGEFWDPNSVVLVEASDMVRYDDASALMLRTQRDRQRDAAIARSDDLLGRLLDQVDLGRDAVIVVAPYATGGGTDLTVVGVHAPAVEAGLLSSGTTRRPGFVQTVDVGPSILSLVGAEQPSSMEGTVMERALQGVPMPIASRC